jgi:hypothetical protein
VSLRDFEKPNVEILNPKLLQMYMGRKILKLQRLLGLLSYSFMCGGFLYFTININSIDSFWALTKPMVCTLSVIPKI